MMTDTGANDLVVKIRLVCPADHAPEIASFFAGTLAEPSAVLVAEDSVGKLVGVAELSIRIDLPSLIGTRVGYVEGLYVVPGARGRGVACSLLLASRASAEVHCLCQRSRRSGDHRPPIPK